MFRPLVPVLNHSGYPQADIQGSRESGDLVPEGKIKAMGHTQPGEYVVPGVGYDVVSKVYHEDDNNSNNKTGTTDGD